MYSGWSAAGSAAYQGSFSKALSINLENRNNLTLSSTAFQADYSSDLAFTPHSLNHPRPRCLSASCSFMDQQSTFEAVLDAPVTHPDPLSNLGG
ncbi:hypothetical protein GOODEAATRI_004702 [Goodea atripinnis]|uniref:Uncharacterized protein n=1 Tax=Goodea atripinnis TaxID=208336 RepID=A0ABV0PV93_9TELE